jgi:hypothetical protein
MHLSAILWMIKTQPQQNNLHGNGLCGAVNEYKSLIPLDEHFNKDKDASSTPIENQFSRFEWITPGRL